VAFGPLATPAFYLALLAHTPGEAATAAAAAAAGGGPLQQWLAAAAPPAVWVAAAVVGITTSVILFCSHFHQIEGDAAAGKRSPLVRLGTARATRVLAAAVAAPYALAAAAATAGALPAAAALLLVISLPPARALVKFAEDNHTTPARVAPLKRYAIKWHIAVAAALAAGLAAGRCSGALAA
jgi:1,4-dihydroxy-2-naphthoate octaprenyltransferase